MLIPPGDDRLKSVTKTGEVPQSRLCRARDLIAIHDRYEREDETAAMYRANGAAMINGERPFNPAQLRESGMADASNNNFGEAQALRDAALAPYIEMIGSVPRIVDISLDIADKSMAHDYSEIVSEHFDWMIKQWDQFHDRNNLLTKYFVEDGISVAMWPNDVTWQWKPIPLGRFLLDRDTEVGDENIECATITDRMGVTQLYKYIRDEEEASRSGWNINAVKKAIYKASRSADEDLNWSNHWEIFVRRAKENDIYLEEYDKVKLIYGIVREFNGKISLFVVSKDVPDQFLYCRYHAYDSINDIVVPFTYGVGEGTYHTIRGLKQRMYYPIQHSNRLLNRMVDAAELAACPMWQLEGEVAENFAFTRVGPFCIVPPGFTETQVRTQPLNENMMLVYQTMQQLVGNNTGQYQGRPNTQNVSRDVTAEEIKRINYTESILGSSQMSLFYVPYTKLWTTCYKRVVSRHQNAKVAGGELAMEFIQRCMKAGIDRDMLNKVKEIRAVRAVGNGSPQIRRMHAEQILAMSGSFDEQGKESAIRDALSAITGSYEIVDRYVPKNAVRTTVDHSIANLENANLMQGIMPQIEPSQNHFVHFDVHVNRIIIPWLEAMKTGQIELAKAVAILRPAVDHATEHAVAMSDNRLRQQDVARARKILSDVSGELASYERGLLNQMEAQQRESAAGAQPNDPQAAFEMQKMQMDLQRKQLEIEASQQRHAQEMEKLDREMQKIDLEGATRISIDNAKAAAALAGKLPPTPRGQADAI